MRLAGKVALVTGAGQGMGRAIARRFAEEGATVVAMDLNMANAQQTLEGLGGKSIALAVNVADAAAVNAAVDEAARLFGHVDILVNNAGTGGLDAFADISDENWARVLGVNLNGPFYCARAAVRVMQKAGRGVVINISSTSALSGDGPAHYVVSKAALLGLTRVMAKELAKSGIRVNTLMPGPTNTAMMQGIPKEWADAIIAGVPMARMAEPEDIARVALFLACDESGFVTGQTLAVNGGSAFI